MLGLKYRAISMKTICLIVAIALSFGLVSCDKIDLSSGFKGFSIPEIKNVRLDNSSNVLSEVAPPNVIEQLNQTLSKYQPQVTIVSPRSNTTVQDTTVEISLAVEDYPIFKDDRFGLGPHLNLIVDNEHYEEIYSLEKPIVVKNLKPGTHTVRVVAEKPWHESFKNQGAFAQTTFNVLTETKDNSPDLKLPLLTYNQPDGVYTAEPIMLDFYLTNMKSDDWQVRAKVNGESFIIDEWQSFYLKGFQEGNNLIELELLDGNGQVIENTFNKTIRLITYVGASTEDDTLAQLVSNKISFSEAVAITEPNYYIQPVGEPEEVKTTENLASETPVEEEISEPSVEDLTSDKVTFEPVEDKIAEEEEIPISSLEPENNLNQEVNQPEFNQSVSKVTPEIIEPTVEDLTEEGSTKNIDSDTQLTKQPLNFKAENQVKEKTIEVPIAPPENITASEVKIKITPSASEKISVTTPTTEKTNSLELDQDKAVITITPKEGETTIKITETVITPDENVVSDTTTKNPLKKLKVPSWWKTFVTNLETVVHNATYKIKALFAA